MNTQNEKGIVYDSKAQIMGQINGNLSGHAGLFSSSADMANLAKGIIDGKILDTDHIRRLTKNRTGKEVYYNGEVKNIQCYGMLCYSKNPRAVDSEVYHALSGLSFTSAGWIGTHFTVDYLNGLYLFLGGNKAHNRITFIDSSHQDKIITSENGKRSVVLPDGTIKTDSSLFAWKKGNLIEAILNLTIQYQFLYDYLSIDKDIETERIRKI